MLFWTLSSISDDNCFQSPGPLSGLFNVALFPLKAAVSLVQATNDTAPLVLEVSISYTVGFALPSNFRRHCRYLLQSPNQCLHIDFVHARTQTKRPFLKNYFGIKFLPDNRTDTAICGNLLLAVFFSNFHFLILIWKIPALPKEILKVNPISNQPQTQYYIWRVHKFKYSEQYQS